MSALALLLLFRAPLASAKAIVLNLCSVAAGYGIVVLVFQLGHGSEFFGVEARRTSCRLRFRSSSSASFSG
jgi:RND superfamily putative drug exporter